MRFGEVLDGAGGEGVGEVVDCYFGGTRLIDVLGWHYAGRSGKLFEW